MAEPIPSRPHASGGAPAEPEHPRRGEVLDWTVALRTVNGNQALLAQLIEAFLDECPERLAQVQSSLEAGDLATVRRAAHTLAGTARYFGAEQVAACAKSVQEAPCCDDARRAAAGLGAECERLCHSLDEYLTSSRVSPHA